MLVVACDILSPHLEAALQEAMPNLQCMALDPIYVVMKYEWWQWKKCTPGSKWLWQVVHTLCFVRQGLADECEHRLGAYDWSSHVVGESVQETALREIIRAGTMPEHVANGILEIVGISMPFRNRVDLVGCIVVIVAGFPAECRTPDASSKPLIGVLWTHTEPQNVERLLNGIRFRHFIPADERVMISRGTTSNEAVHSELKRWFYNQRGLYQSTVIFKFSIFLLSTCLFTT